MPKSRVELLTEILLDREEEIGARDDAAMDLGGFNDDIALEALISVVQDRTQDEFIMAACGESIAEIWVRRNFFDPKVFKKFNPIAQREVRKFIKIDHPEWLKELEGYT